MKKRDEVLVGLVLLISVVSTLAGTIWIVRGGLKRTYPMYSRFPWGVGLKQGQQVLLAGVQIGFVEQVSLDPNGTVLVRMKIQQQYRIPQGSTATVEANGIFGDQLIAVRPVLGVKTYLAPDDSIPVGKNSPGTAELLGKGDSIATDLRAITASTRRELVEGGGMQDVRLAVRDLTKLVAQLSAVTAEQSAQLTRTQETLRRAIASIDSVKVDSTLRNIRATSASLEALSRELKTTNTQVQGVLTKVTSGNGTAAKLLNDGSLYTRLDGLIARVDSLTADFKANPKKYINLKIF
ncbi:MAG: MlaD family protein [Gemmatimonadaceae bacterium]|jgi:phospholipid/cholesterol/gamma-HCH transport system substrate-binding protein